ncbi:MAG: hypothetical protein AB8B97_01915 [Granulosicoccus sp.]
MSLPQNISVRILESIGTHLWGFKPNMMRYFVREYGPVKSVMWFLKNMPEYERILKTWGPIRTHLMSTAISTLNGCSYCTYGHAYAFQLQFFKKTDQLFPLDEHALIKLHGKPEKEVFDRLASALEKAQLSEEVPWLNRLSTVRSMSPSERCAEASRGNADDKRLLHLLSMFSVLNACGLKHHVSLDEAHDPINQDKPLRARYAKRRTGNH